MKTYSTKRSIKKFINEKDGLIMLNIGCGTDYKSGWINVDNNSDHNIDQLDVNWDMRKPLPIDDNTVDFIFNEHFVEHLTPEEARVVLTDLMRVLKPGGIMRIAMPDLASVVNDYLNVPLNKDPVIKDHGLGFIQTKAEWMNMSFRWWGHKWLYDWDELVRRFNEIGYSKLTRAKLRQSKYKELKKLEVRDGSILIAEVEK
jgi:predicted SAM-dependent methyltransferase